MEGSRDWRAVRGASRVISVAGLVIGAALALAACNSDNRSHVTAVQPRGATVAFESIDGPPQAQFRRLVEDLNNEAQARSLAVIARKELSAYRVRGYLAATVDRGQTTISWVWDVFDRNQQRALRISGSETAQAGLGQGWGAADNAMMQRIAQRSVAELAAFLTSPAVAPGTPNADEPQIAFALPDVSTPEAAGIFRIVQPNAEPVSTPGPTSDHAAAGDPVPMPPRRPAAVTAVSSGETITLAAVRR